MQPTKYTIAQAINLALASLEQDDQVILLGQILVTWWGFSYYRGAPTIFGRARVIDTPLAEATSVA